MYEMALNILEAIELIGAALALLGTIIAIYYTVRGFLPVLIRLGNGLAKRKIAIVATGDVLGSIEGLILDSELFDSGNVIRVGGRGEIEALSRASIILVHWADCSEFIDAILSYKKESTALIVYAPYKGGRIPDDVMERLDERKHVIVNNFRGRLMNDIVSSMITTGYEKH